VSGPAQVDSVNVGRPKLLLINGQPNKTGIDKQPTDGPVELRDDAVAGDAVVDREHHGGYDKAVYAYASEDYAWWSGELGRELGPGAFGENLTTSGIAIAEAPSPEAVASPPTPPSSDATRSSNDAVVGLTIRV